MNLNLQPFAIYFGAITMLLALVITVMIILQSKGSDMSSFLGGESSGSFRTKRGMEAVIHKWTIYFSVLFFFFVFITFIAMGQAS